MVHVENVSVDFRTKRGTLRAVDQVSLKIIKGDIFGIVGTSGAGKSSLLRTINNLERPSQGSIIIDGIDITSLPEKDLRRTRRSIGMIFQHYNLAHTKTVYENIAIAMIIAGKKRSEIDERIPELLALVGLTDKSSAYPSQLSGGQKQRVAIARALANKPEILLCDEPTSALDLETTKSILELIRDINRRFGITVILISHEMDVIKNICTRVAVMSSGKVVELGDAYRIFAQPAHEVTKQLVRHSLNIELPPGLLDSVKGPLIKIIYRGKTALDPVLSESVRRFGAKVNILHGKIEYIGGQPIGIFLVNVTGTKKGISETVAFLRKNTADSEVING